MISDWRKVSCQVTGRRNLPLADTPRYPIVSDSRPLAASPTHVDGRFDPTVRDSFECVRIAHRSYLIGKYLPGTKSPSLPYVLYSTLVTLHNIVLVGVLVAQS